MEKPIMVKISKEIAEILFQHLDIEIFILHEDGTESVILDVEEFYNNKDENYGIELFKAQ